MKKTIGSFIGVTACFLSITLLLATNNQTEHKAVVTNRAGVRQGAQQLVNHQGAVKQERMKARIKSRAIGAAQRRERLMARREERKKMVEQRRALIAKRQAELAAQGGDQQTLSKPIQKPAAPQNSMLTSQVSNKSVVFKGPATQIKKS